MPFIYLFWLMVIGMALSSVLVVLAMRWRVPCKWRFRVLGIGCDLETEKRSIAHSGSD
jgi:hypothetical protein